MIIKALVLSLNMGIPGIAPPVADATPARVPHTTASPAGSCWKQIGSFATKDQAWAVWREAQRRRLSVSRGIAACDDAKGYRGYCFRVYYGC